MPPTAQRPLGRGLAWAVFFVAAATPVSAQTPVPTSDDAALFHLVKHFDFDEQKLGNFEKTPMYWKQLRGPGLPRYARGEFDMSIGHEAPPSFALRLNGANVVYEFESINLTVVPYADYRIVGWVRAEDVVHSRAFLTSYFVDRFGDVVPGSARVSNLIASTGAADEPWQQVVIDIAGEYPSGYALRLQVWLLQRHNWEQYGTDVVDPIVRRDVHAIAWFDDISIHRLPRTRLSFSHAGNIADAGEAVSLLVSLSNTTREPLTARVRVEDANGRGVHEQIVDAPALREVAGVVHVPDPATGDSPEPAISAAAPVDVPLPTLPPGIYDATLSLIGGDHTLLERSLRFAVLPRLPTLRNPRGDLGVDLGIWPDSPPESVPQLLAELGCGAAKLGVACPEPLSNGIVPAGYSEIAELIRKLAEARVETVGVLACAPPRDRAVPAPRTRDLLSADSHWADRFAAMLAQLGGLVTTWQIEVDAAADDPFIWENVAVERVRTMLKRFMSLPILVIPEGPTVPRMVPDGIPAVTVSATLPVRRIPRFCRGLADAGLDGHWLALESSSGRVRLSDDEQIEFARRFILARATNPGRLFVDAPLEFTAAGGLPRWQPTDAFIPARTLFRTLSGHRAIASFSPAEDVIAILFDGPYGGRLAIWSWRDHARIESLAIHLGAEATVLTLDGRTQRQIDALGRTVLPVGPLPLLVIDVDVALTLLAARARFEPRLIELTSERTSQQFILENHYPSLLAGEIVARGPEGWQIEPQRQAIRALPGESVSLPLEVKPPPNAVAGEYAVRIALELAAPSSRLLEFEQNVTVGLEGIRYDATARRVGEDLHVDATLFNDTMGPVSFRLFSEVSGRPRVETVLVGVRPGGAVTRSFVYRDAGDIRAQRGLLGFREIRGSRMMNALVEIPD